MPANLAAWTRPAAAVAITVLLFLINGAEFAYAYLRSDVAQEALGAAGAAMALLLGYLIRRGYVPLHASPRQAIRTPPT